MLHSEFKKTIYTYSKGAWGLSVQLRGMPHLHGKFNFTESILETAKKSLYHSCRTELTRQGISLPQDRQSYSRRLSGIQFCASTLDFQGQTPGRSQTQYIIFLILQSPVFLLNSRFFHFHDTLKPKFKGPPFPEVTESICRVPSILLSQSPQYFLPVHLCRFIVRYTANFFQTQFYFHFIISLH